MTYGTDAREEVKTIIGTTDDAVVDAILDIFTQWRADEVNQKMDEAILIARDSGDVAWKRRALDAERKLTDINILLNSWSLNSENVTVSFVIDRIRIALGEVPS